ncbi:hypothetical protein Tco_0505732 [Tanacetum coccineum]
MVFHNEDGNPARANIKQALGYLKDGDGDGNSQFLRCVKASANSDVMYFFTSAQDGDPSQDDVRLCLGDDLKKAQDHSQIQAYITLGKRKVASGVPRKALPPKVQKVPTRASKVAGEASTPLDVDSNSDIHAKELKDVTDCHWVVAHVTPPSWKQHLREISIEDKWMVFIAKIKDIESEREMLKSSKIQLLQEIDSLKQDRAAVVSKVIPDAAMKLVRRDGLAEYVINPYASLEQLLSKKPPSL